MKIFYLKWNIFYLKILVYFTSLASGIYLFHTYFNTDDNVYENDLIIERTLHICKKILDMPTAHNQYILRGTPQRNIDSPFSVSYNYLQATKKYGRNESVTYATHVTPEFISKIKKLTETWDGPISVAVYAPATDLCLALDRILFIRNCDSPEIKARVSWHIYWPKNIFTYFNMSEKFLETKYVCSAVVDFSIKPWRLLNNYSYPINVGRNVARHGAKTEFILPSDVELIPSHDLSSQFIKYIYAMKTHSNATKKVYVVPVFETKHVVPKNKDELIVQLFIGKTVYFHRFICKHCQRFPKFEKWSKHHGNQNKIMEFSVVLRQFPYHRWEPIFICTNNEPLYDEELNWEGLQDKMAQMHELCLLNYTFVILDRAFLVHLPGIKTRKDRKEVIGWRKVFVEANAFRYNKILMELESKYGFKKECRKH